MGARGYDIGDEYFGDWGKAMYTLFQVLQGDAWQETAGRALFVGTNGFGGYIFFASHVFVQVVIILAIVRSVTLEKMGDGPEGLSGRSDASSLGERIDVSNRELAEVKYQLAQVTESLARISNSLAQRK